MEKLLSGGRGGRLIPDLCWDLSAMTLLVLPPQLKFQLLPECSLTIFHVTRPALAASGLLSWAPTYPLPLLPQIWDYVLLILTS